MAKPITKDIHLGITRYEYGDRNRKQVAVLQIETDKHYNGGILSDANVFWVGNGSRQRLMGLGGGGDFGKRLKASARTVKATQKAIDAQHAEVFTPETVAELVEEAKATYSRYVADGVDGFRNTYEPDMPHASDCAVWAGETCECSTGKH